MPTLDSLSGWRAIAFRVTAFPVGEWLAPSGGWWQQITGEPPLQKTERPREGLVREAGPFGSGVLSIDGQPRRIDLRLTSATVEESSGVNEWLGSSEEAAHAFEVTAALWLSQCPTIRRLAFGAELIRPTDSIQAGYEILRQYLSSVNIDAAHSADLLYRINRPRNLEIGGITVRINRLSTWSVGVIRLAAVNLSGEESQLTNRILATGCQLELDINTAADLEGELPAGQVQSILGTLISFGLEIAEHGDIT